MAKETKIKFEDYSDEVFERINRNLVAALYEAAGELQGQAARNSRVDTGQLKGSWDYVVNEAKLEAQIGSPLENAIWEEFGTGEYAANGDGRKTPWRYRDAKGKWHTTRGKRPNRTLETAFRAKKKTVKSIFERCMK